MADPSWNPKPCLRDRRNRLTIADHEGDEIVQCYRLRHRCPISHFYEKSDKACEHQKLELFLSSCVTHGNGANIEHSTSKCPGSISSSFDARFVAGSYPRTQKQVQFGKVMSEIRPRMAVGYHLPRGHGTGAFLPIFVEKRK